MVKPVMTDDCRLCVQTLGSFTQGGCVMSAVFSLLIGGSSTVYAGHIAWHSLHPPELSSQLQ